MQSNKVTDFILYKLHRQHKNKQQEEKKENKKNNTNSKRRNSTHKSKNKIRMCAMAI